MKNTHICPKCASPRILRVPDHPGRYASGNNIYTSTVTLRKKIPVIRYICRDCGYVENWVEQSQQLAEMEEAFG